MAIRPLPGELLEHLPRGIDQSQISHHVPLRGGPDGLLGETHLLLFHGELLVLTRGSAKSAFRRLDLDPDERAMLLAESWSVQLSLPTRGGPTCFEVSSKQVATVLALISAVKPGQHGELEDESVELPVVQAPVETPVETPVELSAAVETPVASLATQAPTRAAPAPTPRRAPTNLRDAFAANEEAERDASRSAQIQTAVSAAISAPTIVTDDVSVRENSDDLDDLDDLNIDLDQEVVAKAGPLAHAASSVAASFRGAAASLRSAASSLRRSSEPEDDDDALVEAAFGDDPSSRQEDSLSIDIDDVFADVELQDPRAARAEAPSIAAPILAEPIAEPTRTPRPAVTIPPAELAPRSVAPDSSTATASRPSRPRSTPSAPTGLRFNFDDLPTPARTRPTSDTSEIDPNVSLAEFFDRHVPRTSDDTPSRRRRMVPDASTRTAAPQAAAPQTAAPQTAAPQTAAPQTAAPQPAALPLAEITPEPSTTQPSPQAIVRTPVAPPPPFIAARAPATAAPPRLSATRAPFSTDPIADPVPARVTSPVAPAAAMSVSAAALSQPAAAVETVEVFEDDPETPTFDPILNSPGGASAGHRANRHLVNPRWTKGARRSATAAASAATSAASATATAASAAVGRARVAANRLLDRRLTRKGRPRSNRRRQGSSGGRPTMAIAAALMTVAVLIYWALPSGDLPTSSTDDAALPQTAGLSAPLAEIASEIQASQASMVPAAIGNDLPPLPGSEAEDETAPEAEVAPATDRDFYGAATLTPESPQPELLALKECRPLAERGLLVRVKVEIDEPTGTVPEVWVGDGSMDRQLRQCVSRQFKKATFVPKTRGKLIKQRLKLHF